MDFCFSSLIQLPNQLALFSVYSFANEAKNVKTKTVKTPPENSIMKLVSNNVERLQHMRSDFQHLLSNSVKLYKEYMEPIILLGKCMRPKGYVERIKRDSVQVLKIKPFLPEMNKDKKYQIGEMVNHWVDSQSR